VAARSLFIHAFKTHIHIVLSICFRFGRSRTIGKVCSSHRGRGGVEASGAGEGFRRRRGASDRKIQCRKFKAQGGGNAGTKQKITSLIGEGRRRHAVPRDRSRQREGGPGSRSHGCCCGLQRPDRGEGEIGRVSRRRTRAASSCANAGDRGQAEKSIVFNSGSPGTGCLQNFLKMGAPGGEVAVCGRNGETPRPGGGNKAGVLRKGKNGSSKIKINGSAFTAGIKSLWGSVTRKSGSVLRSVSDRAELARDPKKTALGIGLGPQPRLEFREEGDRAGRGWNL